MKGRFRLLASIGVAAVLSVFMMYTALAGGDVQHPVVEVEQLADDRKVASTQTVELVGVAAGPLVRGSGNRLDFFVTDRARTVRLPVSYSGSVPDAFRIGRHVVVRGRLDGSTFQAKRDTLMTKCPSKFQGKQKT